MTTSLHICGEVELRVHHNLMGRMKDLAEVLRVCAHPQALAQCRGWLDEHLPRHRTRAGEQQCRRRAPGARRKGHCGHRRRRGGRGLRARRSWRRTSRTRRQHHALPRARQQAAAAQRRATRPRILVSAAETGESGALFRLLEPLAKHKVNMTRIESRPSRRRKWDYVFFIDIEGHAEDGAVAKALAELRKRARCSACSGSYPRGHTVTLRGPAAAWRSAAAAVRDRALCDRQADQRTGARAGRGRHRQAGLQRESAGAEPAGHWRRCSEALAEVWLYPDGNGHELKAALAQHHGVGIAQVTLGNGSNDLLVLLAEAFLTPQPAPCIRSIAFAIYGIAVQATGAQRDVAAAHRAGPAHAVRARSRRDAGAHRRADAAGVSSRIRTIRPAPGTPTAQILAFLERVPACHRGAGRGLFRILARAWTAPTA